jgi:hypothetical protein
MTPVNHAKQSVSVDPGSADVVTLDLANPLWVRLDLAKHQIKMKFMSVGMCSYRRHARGQ